MRVITLNVNGVRSAAKKGLFRWLNSVDPDVVALQETRSQERQLPEESRMLTDMHAYYVDAQRKGYSGVALFTRRDPASITRGLGWPDFDAEGRFVMADLGDVLVGSLYVPSGTSGAVRQAAKMRFLERLLVYLAQLRKEGREFIICGDYNIAHKEIDTYDPVRNAKITGFFPEERAWMDDVIQSGWIDAFRVVNAEPKQYSWWANWPAAWQHNLGWRIDYQMITPGIASRVKSAWIYRDERFSDHAPVVIDYDLPGNV
jgi:exodeoxyribonuclease III